MKIFRKSLSLFLIFLTIVGVCGCQSQVPERTIDWDLHGVWVTADGVVQDGEEGLDFSLSGTLPTEYELKSYVDMKLNFVWPEGFTFINMGTQTYTGGADIADKHENQPIYHGGQYVDCVPGDSGFLGFTICPDEGFVVIHGDSRCLVASIDPNADPAEIYAFFKEYVTILG